MSRDQQALIQSLIQSELIFSSRKGVVAQNPPVVALSRDHGAGGELIARRLADMLGIRWYDKEILESVAADANVEPEQMERLDDRFHHDTGRSWFRSLFTTNTAFPESYRHHLVNVMLGIARNGGVIVGRGGHIILANRPVLRLRITGSEQRCAERVAERENIPTDEALEEVRKVNRERGEFLWNMFNRRLNDPTLFDLTINTDRFDALEDAADLVLIALIRLGFQVNTLHGKKT